MANGDRSVSPASWHELWQEVSEGLLAGLQHELNNRIAALSAVAQVLGADLTNGAPLVSTLGSEVSRLQGTVAMLSLLRRSRSRMAEPVQPPDLLPELVRLLPHHNQLKEVEFEVGGDPAVLPLWVERDQLTRVLLVLLTAAGLEAQRGGGGAVRVSYGGDETTIAIRVEADGGAAADDEEAESLDVRAADEPSRELGGELVVDAEGGDGVRYELRLPTLLEARRRERS